MSLISQSDACRKQNNLKLGAPIAKRLISLSERKHPQWSVRETRKERSLRLSTCSTASSIDSLRENRAKTTNSDIFGGRDC